MKKLGNLKQIVSAYEIEFKSGNEQGKRGYLVSVGELEVLFNLSNALDIAWVKYGGKNISFLSKNGLNSNEGSFAERFEGGFLYTCGLDNVSSCVPDKPVHGSLHYRKAEECSIQILNDRVILSGKVNSTSLFGENLQLCREYVITSHEIKMNDKVVNRGFQEARYALLYHINFGYPFLDEGLKLEIPSLQSEGLTDFAAKNYEMRYEITDPKEKEETVYYHTLKEGIVRLFNEMLGVGCTLSFDLQSFATLIEWKSMIAGDYALGIEPSTTRFDNFKMEQLAIGASKEYTLIVRFIKE